MALAELAAGAGTFTSALSFGLPFSLGYQALRNFATALKRPHAALIVMLITVVFNAAGDYALIFGHFGQLSGPNSELFDFLRIDRGFFQSVASPCQLPPKVCVLHLAPPD